jgi:hypothetical protein
MRAIAEMRAGDKVSERLVCEIEAYLHGFDIKA